MFTVDVAAGVTEGLGLIPDALAVVRRRQLDAAERFPAEDWDRPSRCERWTAHDVLRHVRDGCRLHADGLAGAPTDDVLTGFDARRTPQLWLEASAGETPAETIASLRTATEAEDEGFRARVATHDGPDHTTVVGPYGPVHWTVLSAHVLWDSWVHERDIGVPLGLPPPSTPTDEAPVALYALLIASVASLLRDETFETTLALSGSGCSYVATVAPGRVSLRCADPSGDEELCGELVAVVDALCGRGEPLEAVLAGSPAAREPFTWLRTHLG